MSDPVEDDDPMRKLRTIHSRVPFPTFSKNAEDDLVMREGETGVYVRALHDRSEDQVGGGNRVEWINADIAWLEPISLLHWMHSRGGCNKYAESVVMILFGHDPNTGFNHPEAA